MQTSPLLLSGNSTWVHIICNNNVSRFEYGRSYFTAPGFHENSFNGCRVEVHAKETKPRWINSMILSCWKTSYIFNQAATRVRQR